MVLSIGCNNQWGYEHDIVNRTACDVAVFDCTLAAGVAPPADLQARVKLYPVCLGEPAAVSASRQLLKPAGGGRLKYVEATSEQLRFVNFSQLLALATGGHTFGDRIRTHRHDNMSDQGGRAAPAPRAARALRPALLKMDIEGFEWSLLPAMLASQLAPTQIAVELHLQTPMQQLPWFGRYKAPAEILALGAMLNRAGYVVAHRQDNRVCPWCTELLLVRQHGGYKLD